MRIGIYLEYDGNKLTASSNEMLVMATAFVGSEYITAFVAAADAERCQGLLRGKCRFRR